MGPNNKTQLMGILKSRVDIVAESWHLGIAPLNFVPATYHEVREILTELAGEIISLLLAETFDQASAQSIGARLARLGFTQPECLGVTQQTLAHELCEGLPPEHLALLQPTLTDLLSSLAVGYNQQAHEIILEEQEQIRVAIDLAREKAEQARKEIESRNQAILQAQPDLIVIMDLQGNYLDAFTTNSDLYPLSPGGLTDKKISDYLSPSSVKIFLDAFRKAIRTGEMQVLRSAHQASDKIRHYDSRIVPFQENQVLTIVRDITDQVQAEEAIKASEARYRAMVEDQTELICRWKPNGVLSAVNGAFCRFFQMTDEELIGKDFQALVFPEELSMIEEHITRLRQLAPDNPVAQVVDRTIKPDGEIAWLQWLNRAIFDENGKISEYQSVGRDITDLKKTEDALKQTNSWLEQLTGKLITIHEDERRALARELHDNILNGIGAMMIGADEGSSSDRALQNYQNLIASLRQTIDDLRPPMLNFGLQVALDGLFNDLIDRLQEGQNLTMDVHDSSVRFDSEFEMHLYRIVQEACENVLRHSNAQNIRISGEIEPGLVKLMVEDDGIGFETGEPLNLAAILASKHYGLANMHERSLLIGAQLKIASTPGKGTKVSVSWEPAQ